jgi:hypothetical protein
MELALGVLRLSAKTWRYFKYVIGDKSVECR